MFQTDFFQENYCMLQKVSQLVREDRFIIFAFPFILKHAKHVKPGHRNYERHHPLTI